MAHNVARSSYSRLVDRLNRFPQGAPPSRTLIRILELLLSPGEAELVSRLPIRPFTATVASRAWNMAEPEAIKILDALAGRALLVDFDRDGERVYVLPPPMAGFFEFSLMRVRGDVDQKSLSELFYQYLNVEEDFVRELFVSGETGIGRTFVHEPALSAANTVHVLDYERASSVIESASCRAVGLCYCRHKMHHLGRACDAPLEICMTFGAVAGSLIRHGNAREIDAREGLDLLQKAYGHGLVQLGENVREDVSFICNCCKCCCEGLLAARRFAGMATIHTTNFIPSIDEARCTGCGTCAQACPVDATVTVPAAPAGDRSDTKAAIDENRCLGCGLCARSCPGGAIALVSRPERVLTPVNGMHRIVVMAIERGKLQNLIFDNQVLFSRRALAGLLGVILRLPPVKRALAGRQSKSRYLEALIMMRRRDQVIAK